MKSRMRMLAVSVIGVMLFAAIGLAVPSINVNVQGVGGGLGGIFSPVAGGSVCIPYAIYVLTFPFPRIVPLNVTWVYPGNFTDDLYAGTNLFVSVYYSSTQISSGGITLNSTLPAGEWTSVEISPSITASQVLGGEFHVVVQAPEYVQSSSGLISVLTQELGVGLPNGNYNDYAFLVSTSPLAFLLVRCYDVTFTPPVFSGNGVAVVAPLMVENVLWIESSIPVGHRGVRVIRPERCHRLRGLYVLLMNSPYVKEILPKILEELENGSVSPPFGTNTTPPFSSVLPPGSTPVQNQGS